MQVFVSQPKGVGFSYCTNATSSKTCINDDLTSAQDAYEFFVEFFKAFPEYKSNDFYLTAESYGGVYIPLFMDQIDKHGGVPNFKGAAIGDGCWGTSVGLCAFGTGKSYEIQAEFFFGHNMYDQPLHTELLDKCGNFSNEDVKQSGCMNAINEMNARVGSFDIYNVYDVCGNDTNGLTLNDYNELLSSRTVHLDDDSIHQSTPHPQLNAALNDYNCGGGRASTAWLAQAEVAKALHVKPNTIGMTYNWGPASVSGDLRPLYKKLIQKYRMLIYSGDTDGCVPEWGTEQWVRELGFKEKKAWRPWLSAYKAGQAAQRAGCVQGCPGCVNQRQVCCGL
mmetsp:Transcript_53615/g.126098  ORF Transcript_53615/g.126098 Transcript_53615/m.126098 type:complete len:336 (-) Transcript_53615:173-1180(-)